MSTAQRFIAIDGIRGLAAITVVFDHASFLFFPELSGVHHALGWLGREAVVIFFVISGFAILTSIRGIQAASDSFLLEYALRRGCRIVPPLVFSIAVTIACAAAVTAAGLANWGVDFETFLRGVTLTYRTGDTINLANGPLWSLRLEVCLYVIAGALALAFASRGRRTRIAASLVAVLAVLAMIGKLWFAIPAFLLFGFGAAAACFDRLVAPRSIAVIAAAGLFLLLGAGCFIDTTASYQALETPAGHALQLLSGACLALLFLELRSKKSSVLEPFSRFSRFGSFAYTLYILHMPTLLLISSLAKAASMSSFAARFVVFLLSLLAAFAISVFSAKIFERPEWYRKKARLLLASLNFPSRLPPSRSSEAAEPSVETRPLQS